MTLKEMIDKMGELLDSDGDMDVVVMGENNDGLLGLVQDMDVAYGRVEIYIDMVLT